MTRFVSGVLLFGTLAIVGCGGTTSGKSASKGFGSPSAQTEGSKTTKFGVQSATENAEIVDVEANAEAEKGILIVFDQEAVVTNKGPTGPSKDSTWIEGKVEEVSTDLSHFTVKKSGEDARVPKIGDPVSVYFEWPIKSKLALEGSQRQLPQATGVVEKVENDEYVVRIDQRFSEAKIPKGSVALIRWY